MATVKELREEAKKYGIKGYSRMRKAELEAAVLDFQAMQEHIDEEEKLLEDEILNDMALQAMQEQIDEEEALLQAEMEAAKYTVKLLREVAKSRGIKGYSRMRKNELITALAA